MSAFVGIWNRDGRPVDPAALLRLGDTMAHRAPEEQSVWIDGEVGLSARVLRVAPESASETQPSIRPSEAVLVFDGRIDNRDELLASLPRSLSLPADAPDPVLVLAAYQLHGDRLPEKLSGDFAFALFDSRRRRLLLARDAIGLRTLYHWQGSNTIVFASEIKAILAHPAVTSLPNEDMVALMAARRYSAEDANVTFFDGISRLPPAHMAVVGTESFSVNCYWDFDLSRRVRLRSFPEYVDGFRHYFDQAVRRRMRSASPVAVTVSGGLDSSSIFCLAETFRRSKPDDFPSVLGLSYSPDDGSPAAESSYVRAIEEQYHLPVTRVPLQPMSLLDGADEQLWHGEMPHLAFHWRTLHALLRTARDSGARVLLVGYGADDTLMDQSYLVDLVREFKWRTASSHLREMPKWCTDAAPGAFRDTFVYNLAHYHLHPRLVHVIRRLLAARRRLVGIPAPDSWFSESLLARLPARRETNSAPHATTAHAASQYAWLRSPEQARHLEWNNKIVAGSGIDVALPFLDRDLLSFLIAIPGDVQSQEGVPKALLRNAMRGVLPPTIVERRSKGDYTENMNRGVARDLAEIVRVLQTGTMLERGYVRSDIMNKELARLKDHLQDSIIAAGRIRDLVALDRWLNVFFHASPSIKGAAT